MIPSMYPEGTSDQLVFMFGCTLLAFFSLVRKKLNDKI